MMDLQRSITVSYPKLLLLAVALLCAGIAAAEVPGLYQDWRFLRTVRIYNEQQVQHPAPATAKGP